MEKDFQLVALFEKYLNGRCTEQEINDLFGHFKDASNEQQLKELITSALKSDADEPVSMLDPGDKQLYFNEIKSKIVSREGAVGVLRQLSRTQSYRRIAAAAVFMGVIFLSVLYIVSQRNIGDQSINQAAAGVQDIPAGTNNAVLTLADGTVILLDSVADGQLAEQTGAKVIKINDQISYQGSTSGQEDVQFNTITTARGNQYQLILSDGSKVWLNAESSIRFPVMFASNERTVEITGEAYFEVARDTRRPFKVAYNTASDPGVIEVLGTHFNVNAYLNEKAVKTTLVEGKVRIIQGGKTALLLPDQEALLTKGDAGFTIQDADVDEAVAWKDGYFEFHDAEISDILRQFSRWYDVDVAFQGNPTNKVFSGSIRRQATLIQALEILKLSGIECALKNRTIIIQ